MKKPTVLAGLAVAALILTVVTLTLSDRIGNLETRVQTAESALSTLEPLRHLLSQVRPIADAYQPSQATGAPDVPPDAKDHSLSWCAATENGGTEWLLLSFAEAVLTESIEVHANLNPGAVVRATVIAQDGTETEVWQGPGQSEGADRVTVLPLTSPFAIQGLKWTLDTAAVVG